jgi:hypothetical protein
VALALAIYASIVSTVSLVVAWRAFRSGAPRVEGRVGVPIGGGDDRLVQLDLSNVGSGAVTVWRSMFFIAFSDWYVFSPAPDDGPTLPYRLERHGASSWIFGSQEVHVIPRGSSRSRSDDEMDARLEVVLGGGGRWGRYLVFPVRDEVLDYVRARLEELALLPQLDPTDPQPRESPSA